MALAGESFCPNQSFWLVMKANSDRTEYERRWRGGKEGQGRFFFVLFVFLFF